VTNWLRTSVVAGVALGVVLGGATVAVRDEVALDPVASDLVSTVGGALATQTASLRGFTTRLRHEIDLSALRSDLLQTARASVEPTAASLWLAP
jgi:hypothetical protein